MHKTPNELVCAVVAQRVRARTSTPILFLGEYDEYDDRIKTSLPEKCSFAACCDRVFAFRATR